MVCEDHFHENDIERYYGTKLSDGTISKINKGRATLKPNAIPVSSVKDNYCQKRHPLTQLNDYTPCMKKSKLENIPDDHNSFHDKAFTFFGTIQKFNVHSETK